MLRRRAILERTKGRWSVALALLVAGLAVAVPAVAAPTVTRIAVATAGDATRVYLGLSEPVAAEIFTLVNPYRLVVDLARAQWRLKSQPLVAGVGAMLGVRFGRPDPDHARLVFDMSGPVGLIAANQEFDPETGAYRLSIVLGPPGGSLALSVKPAAVPAAEPELVAVPAAEPELVAGDSFTTQVAAALAEPAGSPPPAPSLPPLPVAKPAIAMPVIARPVIVIDPGHGGDDPGALAADGRYEKDLTLLAARDLMDLLTRSGRFAVFLTRSDGIDMVCLARGIDRAGLARAPALITNINSNSPLRYDEAMIDGMLTMAAAGQAVIVTPFTLAGAMSPVTLAGSLVQQNAEALAGIALMQIAHPGTPAIYGGFTSNVDMRSGAPAFGTPEYTKAALATGQLARRYRLPYRSSNVNTANVVDAQAAYESEMAVWGAVMGHANYLYHGAGWLEGGLVASFEKMIVDAEILQSMAEFLKPIPTGEDEYGIAAMADVGPGGHFFGTAHTLARYETAFYAPLLSDWRNYENWRLAGAEDATVRANRIWKELLAAYQPPAQDPAVVEALEAFVARRKGEIAKAAA